MNNETTQKLYYDGDVAYDPRGHNGFLQNPYLQGPGHEAEAIAWWRGYDAARSRARAHDKDAPS